MVSKKLLKNQVHVSCTRNRNGIKKKKAIFVSQKVIISSILDKSLIDPALKVILPENLSNIYQEMISDASYINETLKNKDYSFYGCNMGFIDGEQMISSKRKALMEFMTKKENNLAKKTNHKLGKNKKKLKEKPKIKTNEESITNLQEKDKVEDDKDSELSSENNSSIRPQRKRNKPLKFKTEDSTKTKNENFIKEESKLAEENFLKTKILEESCHIKSKKLKKEKIDASEVIDLIGDESSDSGEHCQNKNKSTVNSRLNLSNSIGNKSKVYFREPLTRKPTKMLNKRLKEHTLLDKILLGINCVRKWTEKGLHLSRLCETDLALLNKRLTSLNCILTDLQEHTDENNNRYLSVLLKSDLFSSFILSNPAQKSHESIPTVSQDDSPVPSIISNANDQQENLDNLSYNRPKSKLHVPSMYRQRHGLPGILSKPQIKQNDSIKPNFVDLSSNSIQKVDDIPFSLGNSDDKSIKSSTIVANSNSGPVATANVPNDVVANEPQMTASQLLKIKSQKSINEANQKRIIPTIPESIPLVNSCSTTLPRFTLVSNNIVPDKNQTFFYQTTNLPQQTTFPMYLLSNATLLPANAPTAIHRQARVPIPKSVHTITRIPMQNNVHNSSSNFYQSKMSQIPRNPNNLTSKSVVLKNLLQQSNSAQIISSHPVSTNQMVPLSVFQNSQNKRQFVPVNQHLFHK